MSWSVEGNAKKYDEERARPHLNSIVQLNAKLSSLNNGAKCAQSDDLLTLEAYDQCLSCFSETIL